MPSFVGPNEHGELTMTFSLMLGMAAGMIIGSILGGAWPYILMMIAPAFWSIVFAIHGVLTHAENLKDQKEGRQIARQCPRCHHIGWFVRYGTLEAGYFWICPKCDIWVQKVNKSGGNWIHTEGYDQWVKGAL